MSRSPPPRGSCAAVATRGAWSRSPADGRWRSGSTLQTPVRWWRWSRRGPRRHPSGARSPAVSSGRCSPRRSTCSTRGPSSAATSPRPATSSSPGSAGGGLPPLHRPRHQPPAAHPEHPRGPRRVTGAAAMVIDHVLSPQRVDRTLSLATGGSDDRTAMKGAGTTGAVRQPREEEACDDPEVGASDCWLCSSSSP